MDRFLSLIGVVAGLISIGGLIYTLGWKLGKLTTKVDTLWQIYVLETLSSTIKNGYLKAKSSNPIKTFPFEITEKGEELLPEEVKAVLKKISKKKKSIEDMVVLAISELGIENLFTVAQNEEISLRELINILSGYINKIREE